ncbi:MAG: transposase, partial [Pseudomonadales bacterium]|nr:transposase [Pseudomonadales bacterium]
MKRFIEGESRTQTTMFPESLDDYVSNDNPVRVIEAFLEELDLKALGFKRAEAKDTGHPGYHPSTMLKIYVYGYLNRIQTSRRLGAEKHRNVELKWLVERLRPDFKTIADFRRDNGQAIRKVCKEFVLLCRRLELLSQDIVAIDGSKIKALNTREKSFSRAKIKLRIKDVEQSIDRYLIFREQYFRKYIQVLKIVNFRDLVLSVFTQFVSGPGRQQVPQLETVCMPISNTC